MKILNTAKPTPEPKDPNYISILAGELVETADKYLGDKSQPYFRKSNGFSPSATNECARRFVYLMGGVEIVPDVGPQLRRIFDNGDSVHERIVKYFREANILLATEERILSKPVPISGYIDAIVELDATPFIVEIKSINDRGFEARKQMQKPKDDHYKQIQLYMHVRGIHQGLVWYENKNCVPDTARALTRNGWRYHYELKEDDDIMTFNSIDHTLEWEHFSNKKLVYPFDDDLYRVGNKQSNFLATDKHRWFVKDRKNRFKTVHTDELNSSHWIPYHADFNGGTNLLNPYEAEVMGWLVTDGWTNGRSYVIYQSKEEGINKLRSLLRPEDYTEKEYSGNYTSGHINHFTLRGELRELFRKLLPQKSDICSVVGLLNRPALEAMYRGYLGGDGSWTSSGHGVQLGQKDGPTKEAFQIICTLLGMRLNLNEGKVSCYPGNRNYLRAYKPQKEHYAGEVWCPQTNNGYWLMEQNGKVIITGNTQEWLVLLVEYNAKYVEDIMERYGRIYDVHLAGDIPKRPHRQTSKICQGCDVKDRCWTDDREGTEKL